MSMRITLSPEEIKNATEAGIERNRINREAHKTSTIVVGNGVMLDIQGARAEMAVSKAFGMEWTGRVFSNAEWKEWSNNGGRDVGVVEVRSTMYPWGHLPGFEKDHPDYPYVLVIVLSDSEYEIKGFAYGYEFQKKKFWKDPAKKGKPYFCYPQKLLRSVEELQKLIKECK